jgi:hypothetical protein
MKISESIFSALKMETTGPSETLLHTTTKLYGAMTHKVTEFHRRESLKFNLGNNPRLHM